MSTADSLNATRQLHSIEEEATPFYMLHKLSISKKRSDLVADNAIIRISLANGVTFVTTRVKPYFDHVDNLYNDWSINLIEYNQFTYHDRSNSVIDAKSAEIVTSINDCLCKRQGKLRVIWNADQLIESFEFSCNNLKIFNPTDLIDSNGIHIKILRFLEIISVFQELQTQGLSPQ